MYSESGDKSGTFSLSEMVAGVGLSYRIVKCLSAGVNLKYASEKLSKDDSYNAFAADVLLTAKLDGFPMKKTLAVGLGFSFLCPAVWRPFIMPADRGQQ